MAGSGNAEPTVSPHPTSPPAFALLGGRRPTVASDLSWPDPLSAGGGTFAPIETTAAVWLVQRGFAQSTSEVGGDPFMIAMRLYPRAAEMLRSPP